MSKNQALLISGIIRSDLTGQNIYVIYNRHFFIPYGEEYNIK